MKNFVRSRKDTAFINFIQGKQEGETGVSDLYSHLMFPQGTRGCFEGIKLEGRNAGASTIARHGCPGGLQDCCSINIYISNNVQGVNNSVLVDSKVKQGDPGVRISLQGLKLDRGFQKTKKKKTNELTQGLGWITLVALTAIIFLYSII
ncbi:hypothetical protein ACH5RR_020336 [Cinchona calisaya]|uniref:Uncharacterized protein n=1 Tax=Cinchona calisaya TaxID=153742 RepID=A0ABD2ZH56_9GENT